MSLQHWRARQFAIAFLVALALTVASTLIEHQAKREKATLPAGTNKSQIAPIDIGGFMRSSDTNHTNH